MNIGVEKADTLLFSNAMMNEAVLQGNESSNK